MADRSRLRDLVRMDGRNPVAMPWRYKRTVYLVLFGAVAIVLALVVLVRHKTLDSELLGALGILLGLSMLLVAVKWLGENGNNGGPPPPH